MHKRILLLIVVCLVLVGLAAAPAQAFSTTALIGSVGPDQYVASPLYGHYYSGQLNVTYDTTDEAHHVNDYFTVFGGAAGDVSNYPTHWNYPSTPANEVSVKAVLQYSDTGSGNPAGICSEQTTTNGSGTWYTSTNMTFTSVNCQHLYVRAQLVYGFNPDGAGYHYVISTQDGWVLNDGWYCRTGQPACNYGNDSMSVTTWTTTGSVNINAEKPFASSSPWNTATPSGTTWTTYTPMTTTDWWVNGSWVPYYASTTDPVWSFQMPNFVASAWNRNRPAQTLSLRAPSNIAASTDSDHQLEVVEPDGEYIDVWMASVNSTTHVVTSTGPGWGTGNLITDSGVGDLIASQGNNAGTRAANFSISGGRITTSDISGSGTIDHALVLCLPSSMMFNGNTFVSPATAGDSFGSGTVVMGTKFGIPSTTTMPTGLTSLGQKVFNAFKTYGAFVGDFCGGSVPVLQSDASSGFWDSSLHLISPLLRVAS